MKLPNGEDAIVDRRKLEEYCLSPHHPRGRNKARVFSSVGIGPAGAEVLQEALLAAARNAEAVRGGPSVWPALRGRFRPHPSNENRESSEHMDRANRRGLAAPDELLCTIGVKKAPDGRY